MAVDWSYYTKFNSILKKYLPSSGEGETMATQIVTAVNKLVYKWYNDGDVYDNTYYLTGWCNDLSSYANWLYKYSLGADLESISTAMDDDDYEWILQTVADNCLDEEYLAIMDKKPKTDSIYSCEGMFHFEEQAEDEDDWY